MTKIPWATTVTSRSSTSKTTALYILSVNILNSNQRGGLRDRCIHTRWRGIRSRAYPLIWQQSELKELPGEVLGMSLALGLLPLAMVPGQVLPLVRERPWRQREGEGPKRRAWGTAFWLSWCCGERVLNLFDDVVVVGNCIEGRVIWWYSDENSTEEVLIGLYRFDSMCTSSILAAMPKKFGLLVRLIIMNFYFEQLWGLSLHVFESYFSFCSLFLLVSTICPNHNLNFVSCKPWHVGLIVSCS